ncbi:MAG: alpha/beta fold hydrolase [Actinomycetota bacterium]
MRRCFSAVCSLVILLSACGSSPLEKPADGDFRSVDGFLLEGEVFGKGSKAIILAHMFERDRLSWSSFARDLAKDGYLVLTFNFRGYGRSEGSRNPALIDRDIRGAIRYLNATYSPRTMALVGASMGGTAALVAASASAVAGVATLSAPADFRGLDASAVVADVQAPKLFIASIGDAPARESAESLFRKAGDPKADLQLIVGDAHGTDMLDTDHGDQVIKMLKDFLAEVLI